jgi:hypothetical protein
MGLKNLKKRLGKQSETKSGGGDLYSKFKKRNTELLDKIYGERDKRTTANYSGKRVLNQELLEEHGMADHAPSIGDHFFEILPPSYSDNEPYFLEVPVHFNIGLNNDSFICVDRYKGRNVRVKDECHRCKVQRSIYKSLGDKRAEGKLKDYVVSLYPTDRIAFLIWDRTDELLKQEDPEYKLQIWVAPKESIHKEIQEKARNKIAGVQLDVSDISPDGEGRTIGYTMTKNKGDYPKYGSLELIPREKPLPKEIVKKLDELLTIAEENGYNNAIEMFLNIPDQNDIKDAMEEDENNPEAKETNRENDDDETTEEKQEAKPKASLRDRLKKMKEPEPEPEQEDDIEDELMELQTELESMSAFKFKMWCKKNGYEEALEFPQQEAVLAIIDDMYREATK